MVPSFEKRVRAFAIDTAGVTLLLILSLPFTAEVALYAAIGGVFLFYILPYILSSGQTFGKRIQKIKVVDLDGTDVPLWRILLREIVKLGLSVFTYGIYLVVAFFFMSEKTGRTIHDYIFRTKLIDLKPEVKGENVLGKTESMRKRGF